MSIAGGQGQSVLDGLGGDPQIIFWNGSPRARHSALILPYSRAVVSLGKSKSTPCKKRDNACLCFSGWLEWLTPYSNSPKAKRGSQSSGADFMCSCIPGARRSTDTTIVVSSKILPVAGIHPLAAFLDDPFQFRAFGLGKDLCTTFDGQQTLLTNFLAQTMNIFGDLGQLRRRKIFQIFDDDLQCAHGL
jgi:hypothetical protein